MCSNIVCPFLQLIAPRMLGTTPDPEKIGELTAVFKKSCKLMHNHFLKDTKFVNSSEISIADLQALCEFTQFWIGNREPPFEEEHKSRLSQWMEDCKTELQPHFDAAHKMVYLVRDKGVFKGKL